MDAHYSALERDSESSNELAIEEDLIIDALKAVTLIPDHIEEIFSLMKEFKSPLTRVRIQLYENKLDYKEAFM